MDEYSKMVKALPPQFWEEFCKANNIVMSDWADIRNMRIVLHQLVKMAAIPMADTDIVDSEVVRQLETILDWTSDPFGYGSYPLPRQIEKLREWWEYIKTFQTWEQLILAFICFNRWGWGWEKGEWV